MIRVNESGQALAVEIYDMPLANWGSFIAGIPQPLGIGQIELADGSWVHGFSCEGYIANEAEDISEFGGWVAWLNQRSS